MADDTGISLNPSTEDEGLSLPTAETSVPLTAGIAARRAEKTAFAGVTDKSSKDMYQIYLEGREDMLRKEAATNRDFETKMRQFDAVKQLINSKGNVSPEEVNALIDPFNPKYPLADPKTVIERAYAEKSVSSLNTAIGYMRDNLLDKAQEEGVPVKPILGVATSMQALSEYIRTNIENTQSEIERQGFFSKGVDTLSTMLQPITEYQTRGGITGVGYFDGLSGTNRDLQHYKLYQMPFEQASKVFDEKFQYLKKNNPQRAIEWAQSILGQSSWDTLVNNTFTAAMPVDYWAVIKAAGKGPSTAIKLARREMEVRKAANDIITAVTKDPNYTPATLAEGAGDLKEAAVQKVVAGENPLEKASSSLMSTWWDYSKQFTANPGTYLGREVHTRLNDFIDKGKDLFDRFSTVNRVERTPEQVNNPDNIRARMADIRGNFKGPAAMILDLEGPIREPVSGVNWYKMKLGDWDGSQLPDAVTAQARAESIGIADPIIKGQDLDRVFLPKKEVMVPKYEDVPVDPKFAKQLEEVNAKIERLKSDKDLKKLFPKEYKEKLTELKEQARDLKDASEGYRFQGGVTKYVPNPDFHVKIGGTERPDLTPMGQAGGAKYRFFRRDVNVEGGEIEVPASTRAEPGTIAFNLKTGKFEEEIHFPNAIEQQGLGFHIETWIPLRETDDLTRDTMIQTIDKQGVPNALSTNSATGYEALKNGVLGWVRNSDDTMSVNESAQRKAATYAQSNIHKWVQDMTRDLEDIAAGRVRYDDLGNEIPAWKVWAKNYLGGKLKAKEIFSQFERALDEARKTERWFEGPGELQDFYQRSFKRDPSVLETKAYFNFIKAVEGDRMMMELSEFRNRARQGAEQVQLSIKDPKTGEAIKSGFFDAIPLREFPNNTDNYILVLGKNAGDEVLHEIGAIDSKRVKAMTDAIKTGEAKAYMIWDREHQPLDGFVEVAKDKLIRFIYTEGQALHKPLDFNHVTKRAGGHFEWDYDHYLKIADVRPQYPTGLKNKISGLKNFYVGDTTIMPVSGRLHGENIAKIWNEIHGLVLDGKWDEAKPLIQKLGIPFERFSGWYHAAEGKKPMLDATQQVMVVPRNKKIIDISDQLQEKYRIRSSTDASKFRDTLVDATRSGPDNNFKVQYNQERNSSFDLRTIEDVGTQGNPVYEYQPAKMVDPLTTMNRALNRMVNSSFMDDYKLYHVEHWLREAEPYLNGSKNEIRSNPFGWYNKPEWKAVAPEIISNLMSNRFKGQQFVGLPSKFDTWVHSATSQLADGFYAKYGPEQNRGMLTKAATVVPIWMLHHLEDPVSFMRSVTFNFKLGLFAIPQFIVQAQTHSLIWALEPRHGTVGTYGMLLDGWASFTKNPKILETLDDMATKMNIFGSTFRKGEFLEARKELENSGFKNVAGEYSNLNNQLKTRFILNDFEKGLKIGQYPFRLGEQSTRVTAWYTAFREFRDANPTKVITNKERSEILSKADLLTVNMSRASASALNHGVFSLSTQFLTYQIKLAELFWGKRLGDTLAERNLARARMLTFSSLLYGVPNAIGVTGAPISDNLREHFMDDLGYIPGEKWLSTMLNEGLPAWQIAMITGKLPNFGDRFGSQGFQNIKQGLNGSIPWWQAVGGASVSTFANLIKSGLDPYYQYALSWVNSDGTNQRFTIKGADLAEPLKEISSYSTAAKWLAAIETGKWISKNEQTVTDVTPWQASLFSITGMSPQEQDDMFIRNKMIQGEKDAKKNVLKEFIKDWRRGMEAMDNNDPEQAHDYHKNAMARARAVGMSKSEILTAIGISSNRNKAIDSSMYNYWTQGNENNRDDRREYFRRYQQMKDQ